MNKCKAGAKGGRHPNYNKPHIPVLGKHDGKPVIDCLYCGVRLAVI